MGWRTAPLAHGGSEMHCPNCPGGATLLHMALHNSDLLDLVRETLVEMIDEASDPQAILDRLAGEFDKLGAILAPDASLDEIMGMLTSLISDFQNNDPGSSMQ